MNKFFEILDNHFVNQMRMNSFILHSDSNERQYEDSPLFSYRIVNDIGTAHTVEGDIFQSLDEIREQKLNELGI